MARCVMFPIVEDGGRAYTQVLHIKERLVPNPDQAKDWITHELYWRRMGRFTARFFFLAYL